MFIETIPSIVSILFIFAIGTAIYLIANLLGETTYKSKKKVIIGFFIGYLILITALCYNGVFDTVSLPPRIVVLTTAPLLLFYLLFVSNTSAYKNILKEVKLESLVGVHIFRLIGFFFLFLFFKDLLPKPFALVAGIGDIITAIASVVVVKLIRNQKSYAKSIALAWNTFGLLDILLTSFMAIYFTKLSMDTGSMGVDALAKFPFCFIPAFAPATIIFLHISIYRKILNNKYH